MPLVSTEQLGVIIREKNKRTAKGVIEGRLEKVARGRGA
jgi:hypothetical protein